MLASPTMAAKKTLQVWSQIGTPTEGLALAKAYEKSHPGIDVQISLVDAPKFLTAVSAGVPPDVMTIDGPSIANYAMRKLLLPLDSYLAASKLGKDDFFYPAWHQLFYKNKVWALPSETNPCFALFWNQTMFAEAGFDPERPPETIGDMDVMTSKLAVADAKGAYKRFGFVPPSGTWGFHNAMFNWGWMFGGKFYDEGTKKFTVNDPKNIKALTWMTDLIQRYDLRKLTASGGITGTAGFFTGKMAMYTGVPNYTAAWMKQQKVKFKYGMTSQQPYPAGGVKGVTWDGGWTMAIPSGSRKPKEAWDFIRWLCATDEGTMAYYNLAAARLTGYRKSPIYKKLSDDPILDKVIVDILEGAKYGRPVSPATNLLMTELDLAGNIAISMKKSPQQVLDDVQSKVAKEQARYAKYE